MTTAVWLALLFVCTAHAGVITNYGTCARCYWNYTHTSYLELQKAYQGVTSGSLRGETMWIGDPSRNDVYLQRFKGLKVISNYPARVFGYYPDGIDLDTRTSSNSILNVIFQQQMCAATAADGQIGAPGMCKDATYLGPQSTMQAYTPSYFMNLVSATFRTIGVGTTLSKDRPREASNWIVVNGRHYYNVTVTSTKLGYTVKNVIEISAEQILMSTQQCPGCPIDTTIEELPVFDRHPLVFFDIEAHGSALVNITSTDVPGIGFGPNGLALTVFSTDVIPRHPGLSQKCVHANVFGVQTDDCTFQYPPSFPGHLAGNPAPEASSWFAERDVGISKKTIEYNSQVGQNVETASRHTGVSFVPLLYQDVGRAVPLWCNIGINFATSDADSNPNAPGSTISGAQSFISNYDYWVGIGDPDPPILGSGVDARCCGNANNTFFNATGGGKNIACQGNGAAGVCTCSYGRTGTLCLDTFDPAHFDPHRADEECRDDVDICMSRGKCVKKLGGGIECICRPGWFGGGSASDPPNIPEDVMRDMYASIILEDCLNSGNYSINEGSELWMEMYPRYHQCMLWKGNFTEFWDQEAGYRRWTFRDENLATPIYPYDCANNSRIHIPGGDPEFIFTGPVYGGFWCNRCPACNWTNTASCDDVYPDKTYLAPRREHPDAAVYCRCKPGYSGTTCDSRDCPTANYSSAANVAFFGGVLPFHQQENSTCGVDAGHGKCVIPYTINNESARTGIAGDFAFNVSFSAEVQVDGYPAFAWPGGYKGRCVCNPGYVGEACERPICPSTNGVENCTTHGECVPTDCTPMTVRIPSNVVNGQCPNKISENLPDDLSDISWVSAGAELCGDIKDFYGTWCLGRSAANEIPLPPPPWGPDQYAGCTAAGIEPYPLVWYWEETTTDLRSTCKSGVCQCVETRVEPNGTKITKNTGYTGPSCNLRECNRVNGLECNGLERWDEPGVSVCNRDHDNPVCECWRALATPETGSFNIDDGNHYYNGPLGACELPYSDVCYVNGTTSVCSGSDYSYGCFVKECHGNWTICPQTFNRSEAVPSCQCKEETGASGPTCETSVCGNVSVNTACTKDNAGSIRTGLCDVVNETCNCFSGSQVVGGNPNAIYYGPFCQYEATACAGLNGLQCSGHGVCNGEPLGPFSCVCDTGYTGSTCNVTLQCGGTCNVDGGHCIPGTPDVCACFRNYVGSNCDINMCNATGGTTLSHNLCQCPSGSTQYPGPLDEFYVQPPEKINSKTEELLNPTGLSTFRGCRKLCQPSTYVPNTIECGGYVTFNTKPTTRTRCRDLVYANDTVTTPTCTCEGTAYRAPNPNVDQTAGTPPEPVLARWIATPDGLSCKPTCAYCFSVFTITPSTNCPPGATECDECAIDKCKGTAAYAQGHPCQYRDTWCSEIPCEGHTDHVWSNATQKCVCYPEWLYDDTGNCTADHTLCEETGGTLPHPITISGLNEPCVCNFPLRTVHNGSRDDDHLCESACGPYGSPDTTNTTCDCIPGGIVYGTACSQFYCDATLGGTPDFAVDSHGDAVYSDHCDCKYTQYGGTYCNTSTCQKGTPKDLPESGCNCYTGWEGDLCTDNTGCGSHGYANSTGPDSVCVCSPGWTGTYCRTNKCSTLHTDHGHTATPIPCGNNTLSDLPDCVYPSLNYNCECGDTLATFDEATGECQNTTNLDCGANGYWGVHDHNNTQACICNQGYIGDRCQYHVCPNSTEPTHAHSLTTVLQDDGLETIQCECLAPHFIEVNGVCVRNCSYGESVFTETWQRLVNDPNDPHACICELPGYTVVGHAPHWFGDQYGTGNATEGFHCMRDCSTYGTQDILNTTCVCLDHCTGELCDVCDYSLATSGPPGAAIPWYGWFLLSSAVVAVGVTLLVYYAGKCPTTCYKNRATQEHLDQVFHHRHSAEHKQEAKESAATRARWGIYERHRSHYY